MESVLGIFASIDDPRDHTAPGHELPALLFIALAATLCGAKKLCGSLTSPKANWDELADIVSLPGNATPSHDTFSRQFRLLDPGQMEQALRRFGAAMRQGLGLDPGGGNGGRGRQSASCQRVAMNAAVPACRR